MLLSDVLKEMGCEEFEIKKEKEIDILALTAMDINKKTCTFLDNIKYIGDLKENVTMLLTSYELAREAEKSGYEGGFCIVPQPRLVFFKIHNYLRNHPDYARKEFETQIGLGCSISPLASISSKNVVIGDNVTIEEFVVIRDNTVIGDNTIIRAGAKIGGQGFEFKREEGSIFAVEHLGGVVIGNHVEIQYNACIDKAVYPWDNTILGDYVKIDNLVHIGHAVKVKERAMIVAQSGIGGRTVIENDTWIGFGVTISNGLQIGEGARANIGAVVTKNVSDEGSVTGNFAIAHEKFIENLKKNR